MCLYRYGLQESIPLKFFYSIFLKPIVGFYLLIHHCNLKFFNLIFTNISLPFTSPPFTPGHTECPLSSAVVRQFDRYCPGDQWALFWYRSIGLNWKSIYSISTAWFLYILVNSMWDRLVFPWKFYKPVSTCIFRVPKSNAHLLYTLLCYWSLATKCKYMKNT